MSFTIFVETLESTRSFRYLTVFHALELQFDSTGINEVLRDIISALSTIGLVLGGRLVEQWSI